MDGTALVPLEGDPLIGAPFGDRYVIERLIGEGAMGRVYLARHHRMSRQFAIKVLLGDHASHPKMRERFSREAEASCGLSHPNLISVLDHGETPRGLLYLVMDYIPGRELARLITAEAPLSAERVRRFLTQMCAGLAHAHEHGLVHRDFKGENVLVSGSGVDEVARILDFGIAVAPEASEQRLTTSGMVVGTPAYMSPEQATARPLDHRTDLFSLGVVLYEMLAGVLPFAGSPMEQVQQNLACSPPPIHERVPGLVVDGHLETIMRTLMAREPNDRYPDAHAVIAALAASSRADALATASVPVAAPMTTTAAPPDTTSGPDGAVYGPESTRFTSAIRSDRRRRWLLAVALSGAIVGLVSAISLTRSTESQDVRATHATATPPPVAVARVAPPEPTHPGSAELDAAGEGSNTAERDRSSGDDERTSEPPAATRVERPRRRPVERRSGVAKPTESAAPVAAVASRTRSAGSRPAAEKPPSATGADGEPDELPEPSEKSLVSLHRSVGRALAELEQVDPDAVDELAKLYLDIQIHKAQRDPIVMREAFARLRTLKSQIARKLDRKSQ